jgi:hypothetical protein
LRRDGIVTTYDFVSSITSEVAGVGLPFRLAALLASKGLVGEVVVVVDDGGCRPKRNVVVVVEDVGGFAVVVVLGGTMVVGVGDSVVVVVVGWLADGSGAAGKSGEAGAPVRLARSNPPRASRLARSDSDSIGAGWVNSVTGTPFTASAMKSCHSGRPGAADDGPHAVDAPHGDVAFLVAHPHRRREGRRWLISATRASIAAIPSIAPCIGHAALELSREASRSLPCLSPCQISREPEPDVWRQR